MKIEKSFLEIMPIPVILGYFITLLVIVYFNRKGKWKNNTKNFLIVFVLGLLVYYFSKMLIFYQDVEIFTISDLWNSDYFFYTFVVNTAFLVYLAITLYVFHLTSQYLGKYGIIIGGSAAIVLGALLFQYLVGIFIIFYLLLFSSGTSPYIFYPTSTIILAWNYQNKPIKKCWKPYLALYIISFFAYYFGTAFSQYERFPNYGLPLLNEDFILRKFRESLSHSLNFWILLFAFKYLKKNKEERSIKYFPTKPATLILLDIILYIPAYRIIYRIILLMESFAPFLLHDLL